MDKYEFNIKLDQIKKLASKKDYKTAAKIANSMDWRKVKEWTTLSLIIGVQEAAGDYQEARDTAILAYNRNLGGRRLVYKLAEIFIKLKEFEDAEDLYREYARISQHDVNKYILLYNLRKAQGADAKKLIKVLEEYKEHEIDEKYLCELAQLYSSVGDIDNCLKECEEIILWFQDGEYVERAIALKQQYVNITPAQQKILEAAAKKPLAEDDVTKELKFQEAKEKAILEEDELEEILKEENIDDTKEIYKEHEDQYNNFEDKAEEENGPSVDLVQNEAGDEKVRNVFKSFIQKAFIGAEEEEEAPNEELQVNDKAFDKADTQSEKNEFEATEAKAIEPEADEAKDIESYSDVYKDNSEAWMSDDIQDEAITADKETINQTSSNQIKELDADNIKNTVAINMYTGPGVVKNSSEEIKKAGQSIKELINNAKKKIEENYENVKNQDDIERREEESDRIADNIEIPVANYNLYDTQNIQQELAKNLGEFMKENPEEDLFKVVSEHRSRTEKIEKLKSINNMEETPSVSSDQDEDEQIEGQLSISDWIEEIKQEKYGKQETKEFSKAELERMLEERETEKENYEKLLAKQKLLAKEKGEPYDEEQARRNAEQEVIVQAAKTDLTLRTGKATAKIEAEVESIRQAASLTLQIEERAAQEADRIANTVQYEAQQASLEETEEDTLEAGNDFSDAAISDEINEEAREESSEESQDLENDFIAEGMNAEPKKHFSLFGTKAVEVKAPIQEIEPEELVVEKKKISQLPADIRKYFKKYSDMVGLEEQLVEYFEASKVENMSKTSMKGNIIISGNRSSDKTNLAVSIVKSLNVLYPEKPRKIAKTTGESINHKGITKAMPKLKGTALIIEDAGVIQPKRISEMLKLMEADTDGMLVIFEDADTEINVLLSVNPELTSKFNHRIALKQYTVNELVEMAKKYAGKRQYAIDDSALLQLYLKIDRLHSQVDAVHLDQIKEIIDKAIIKAEKRAAKKIFGIKKKRGENGDVFFLAESDFKD